VSRSLPAGIVMSCAETRENAATPGGRRSPPGVQTTSNPPSTASASATHTPPGRLRDIAATHTAEPTKTARSSSVDIRGRRAYSPMTAKLATPPRIHKIPSAHPGRTRVTARRGRGRGRTHHHRVEPPLRRAVLLAGSSHGTIGCPSRAQMPGPQTRGIVMCRVRPGLVGYGHKDRLIIKLARAGSFTGVVRRAAQTAQSGARHYAVPPSGRRTHGSEESPSRSLPRRCNGRGAAAHHVARRDSILLH
jgi:hypothetical protein